MDGSCEIKKDNLMREFMSNPELVDRPVTISHGFAAMRFLVASFDALQVMLVCLATAPFLMPGHMVEAAGIGVMGAGLALLIRRGARPTTSFQRVTIGMVARRAAMAIFAAGFIVLFTTTLAGGLTKATQMLPWVATWTILAATISFAARTVPIAALRRISLRAIQPTVAVVGEASSADLMIDMLTGQGTHLVVAQLDPGKPHQMRRLEQLAARGKIDKVVIVGCNETVVESVCFALSDTPTLVCIGFATSTASSLMAGGIHATQHPPFLPLLPSPISDWRGILKRSLDVVVVVGILPLIAPVLIGAVVAIRLESRGPILFRQWRFGLASKPTQILKFRTMYHDRGDKTGEARTLARDPRVTRVGRILRRTSIDELPQLLNVLRGEMSLVGPRPHATHMKVDGNYYFEAVQGYRIRHRVKPGITGWAQVTGSRGEVDTMDKALERVEKDLWYVRNWSLTLDLRILVMTALGRFASPGAD
jgi:exopolysaccharide biosynthesis polyprenyl glycosylphosphotransferase